MQSQKLTTYKETDKQLMLEKYFYLRFKVQKQFNLKSELLVSLDGSISASI